MELRSTVTRLARSRWVHALVDSVILTGAVVAAFYVRYGTRVPNMFETRIVRALPVWIILNVVVFSVYKLYRSSRLRKDQLISRVIVAECVTFVLALALSYLLREWNLPRPVMVLAFAFALPPTLLWRVVLWRQTREISKGKALVIACSNPRDPLVEKALSTLTEPVMVLDPAIDTAQIDTALESKDVHMVVIGASVPEEYKANLVVKAVRAGKSVELVPDWFHILLNTAKLEQIGDTPTLSIRPPEHLDRIPTGKRLFDVAVAGALLIGLAPLMLLIALAVRLDSPGPALFRQERVGLGNRRFILYKFRTMIDGAEKESGPVLACKNDPRLTRVGKFLRELRLDELPQLLNVLKGDMSLVGPRPERPYFVEQFLNEIPHYDQRLRVPGGVTGLAQVYGRYSTSAEDKLRYDLFYAGSGSAITDVKILFRTLEAMINRSKAS